MMRLEEKPFDLYDHEGGFDVVADKEILDQWIADTEGLERRVALFDWDQTLSKFGAIDIDALTYPAANYMHILLYLLGGQERLTAIQRMFKELADNKIRIIILTNNAASTTKAFRTMAGLLGGRPRIIYSGGAPHYGDKGKTLRGLEEFSRLCVAAGGGRRLAGGKRRRQSTRRNRKHKQQTKRRI